ncbi:MAG TPA: response regulator transcription factor [Gemmatimonadaceae bacterium]|nr:response regulator transcription factor [Gemmatimonadaceae bacterium]
MNDASDKEIRILIVDANESEAEQVVTLLREAQMRVTVERVQSEEGLATALRQFEPDVVLSEYSLPLLDYRTTLKVVQSIRVGTPVIVVSGPLREEDSGSCIRAGAETFISKLNLGILPAAIRAAVEAREPLWRLTARQIQVMRLVASGYRTHEVAEVLKLSEKTVESHRHQLMRKLGLDRTACLIRYAIRVGFTPVASPASLME